MLRNFKIASQVLLGMALIIAAYAFYNIYFVQNSLPPGVCPVNNNRNLLYLGIALSVGSLAVDFYADWVAKKGKAKQDEIEK